MMRWLWIRLRHNRRDINCVWWEPPIPWVDQRAEVCGPCAATGGYVAKRKAEAALESAVYRERADREQP